MATSPFGIVLETALKHDLQGGKLETSLGGVVKPQFYCCISGNTVGVAKDPAAVMSLSATRVCTGVAITVTYSRSWSPSSTLNSWEVDWGDGNISTGAWPGAGSVAHPGGGYSLPGHYHVVLTVTDLLGATSEAEITVEILDCTTPTPIPPGPGVAYPPVALMGGCGASGPHYTANAGLTWANAGGGMLDGVLIYDMKATYSSLGSNVVQLWAATELGLYRGERNMQTGVTTWTPEVLPLPPGYITMPSVVAVTPSRFFATNVMVLVADNAEERVWLYRGMAAGSGTTETWQSTPLAWDYVQLGIGEWEDVPLDVPNDDVVDCLGADNNGRVYAGGWFDRGANSYQLAWWNGTSWTEVTYEFGEYIFAMITDVNNNLYFTGSLYHPDHPAPNLRLGVAKYNGASISWLPAIMQRDPIDNVYAMAYQRNNGRLFAAGLSPTYSQCPVQYYSGSAWEDLTGDAWMNGIVGGDAWAVTTYGNDVYVGGNFHTIGGITYNHIVRVTGGSCHDLDGGTNAGVFALATGLEGQIYVGGAFTTAGGITAERMAYWYGNEWHPMGTGLNALNGDVNKIVVSSSGVVYAFGDFDDTVGGTVLDHTARWDASFELWRPVDGTLSFTPQVGIEQGCLDEYDNPWVSSWGLPFWTYFVSRIGGSNITVPTIGYSSLMDIDANGQYVYIGLLDTAGLPFILRVSTDLAGMEAVYVPGAGTWGGVACDPYYGNIVWAFGDFGTEKVMFTQDSGEAWIPSTNASWGGAEVVRPLLISYWNTDDVVAILNSALQVWQTKDYGATWGQNGTIAFACGCGARDYW